MKLFPVTATPKVIYLAAVGIFVAIIAATVILFPPQPVDVVQLPSVPGVTNLQVDAREITPRVVERIITDPAQQVEIDRLLAENKRLKLQVSQLSVTVASLKSTGGGTVTTVTPESLPDNLKLNAATGVTDTAPVAVEPAAAHPIHEFKDWRLHFVTDGANAKYSLSQQFEVLSTTGRNKDGHPMSLVTVAEIGEKGQRVLLEAKTVNIFADQTKPHWMVGNLNLQAGGGMVVMDGSIKNTSKGFMVSTQWLRRGRTPAAEDSTIAILSPVVFASDTTKELGVFLVSVNVGQLPKTPFADMWISPYIGIYSGKAVVPNMSSLRFGVGLTTTF